MSASSALLVRPALIETVDTALGRGAMIGGWLLTGPPQIGKRLLADRLAAALLSGAKAIDAADPAIVGQIAEEAHPDYFLVTRRPDEKTGKLPRTILVNDIREMIARFYQTSVSGRRVVVIDAADEMNASAANALLKSLEEPPQGATLLLLASAPGRLLPTIRSRCRRLDLGPSPLGEIAQWLETHHAIPADEARAAAALSDGRPGRALHWASGEGREVRGLADSLIAAAATGRDLTATAGQFAARDAAEIRRDAELLVLDRLAGATRRLAVGERPDPPFDRLSDPQRALESYDRLVTLTSQGEALNADRGQTALAMAMTLRDALRGGHVHR
ncbi:DNA polymerase III, delta prime subunit [Parvularcula bermudensis HTCC2503]|uniref:DNA polymerase III, delta prime subunit n=1 Tax=Parvularcula bermudensis (strain ATCC BAA-594 / HTCC2503 / KCTC 12087) TaxID=314260 RepID=E0TIF1_PARBH|nr:AAA family ATPase [Parvularcula bermudensis]ADM10270.1 DNA polymerase III, delta prime subunit [Parvularcula bermudensis HTCC2503]